MRRMKGAALGALALAALGVMPVSVGLGPSSSEDGRASAGSVRLRGSLVGMALAQGPDQIVLENVAFDLGAVSVRFPRAEIAGANLSRAALLELFRAAGPEPAVDRLAALSAQSVAVPELTVEQRIGDQRHVATYRDVTARSVERGRVEALASSGAEIRLSGPSAGSGRYGRMTLDGVDLVQIARLYTVQGGDDPEPLRPVYAGFAVEDIRFTDDKGVEIAIARASGRDASGRPLKTSWAEVGRLFAEPRDGNRADAGDSARKLAVAGDMLDAYAIGAVEVTGFALRDGSGQNPASGQIARLSYAGARPGQPSEFRLDGVEVAGKDGRARLDGMALTGFSLGPLAEGLRSLGRTGDLERPDWRKLIPTLGTIRLAGLRFEPPQGGAGGRPAAMGFAAADLSLTADRPVNGIPTNVSFGVKNLVFEIPSRSDDPGLRDLAALGYRTLDLSSLTAATWNEAANELLVRELSLSGADMGSLTLRGVLGNVTRDAFSSDSAVALVSLLGATARTIDLTVENRGLFERVIAQEARRQRKSPEELRREYGVAAAVAVPRMLGGSPAARAIGQAVARFVAAPNRLALQARARDAVGLGIADMAAITEPGAILDRLEVTATAE